MPGPRGFLTVKNLAKLVKIEPERENDGNFP